MNGKESFFFHASSLYSCYTKQKKIQMFTGSEDKKTTLTHILISTSLKNGFTTIRDKGLVISKSDKTPHKMGEGEEDIICSFEVGSDDLPHIKMIDSDYTLFANNKEYTKTELVIYKPTTFLIHSVGRMTIATTEWTYSQLVSNIKRVVSRRNPEQFSDIFTDKKDLFSSPILSLIVRNSDMKKDFSPKTKSRVSTFPKYVEVSKASNFGCALSTTDISYELFFSAYSYARSRKMDFLPISIATLTAQMIKVLHDKGFSTTKDSIHIKEGKIPQITTEIPLKNRNDTRAYLYHNALSQPIAVSSDISCVVPSVLSEDFIAFYIVDSLSNLVSSMKDVLIYIHDFHLLAYCPGVPLTSLYDSIYGSSNLLITSLTGDHGIELRTNTFFIPESSDLSPQTIDVLTECATLTVHVEDEGEYMRKWKRLGIRYIEKYMNISHTDIIAAYSSVNHGKDTQVHKSSIYHMVHVPTLISYVHLRPHKIHPSHILSEAMHMLLDSNHTHNIPLLSGTISSIGKAPISEKSVKTFMREAYHHPKMEDVVSMDKINGIEGGYHKTSSKIKGCLQDPYKTTGDTHSLPTWVVYSVRGNTCSTMVSEACWDVGHLPFVISAKSAFNNNMYYMKYIFYLSTYLYPMTCIITKTSSVSEDDYTALREYVTKMLERKKKKHNLMTVFYISNSLKSMQEGERAVFHELPYKEEIDHVFTIVLGRFGIELDKVFTRGEVATLSHTNLLNLMYKRSRSSLDTYINKLKDLLPSREKSYSMMRKYQPSF